MLAASSSLAKQLYKLFKKEGIEVIGVVRKDEQIKQLKGELGQEYVLNQTSPTFYEDLKALVQKLHTTVLFECLGGDIAGKIFSLLPAESEMIIFGKLTKTNLVLDIDDAIFS
jgi:NADPH:quinone reductase-like Zn-dependent oxidoreductase